MGVRYGRGGKGNGVRGCARCAERESRRQWGWTALAEDFRKFFPWAVVPPSGGAPELRRFLPGSGRIPLAGTGPRLIGGMKLLFLGDVMGRAGRAAVAERLPGLRAAWGLDFVVVNGENASQGAGLTGDHAKELLAAGADCLTLGDHAFDQKDMLQLHRDTSRGSSGR